MAARTDHDRRDAQHAARLRISGRIAQYSRRALEAAYAHIEEEATNLDGDDELIDWFATGEAAADRALAAFGIIGAAPEAAIDAPSTPALEA